MRQATWWGCLGVWFLTLVAIYPSGVHGDDVTKTDDKGLLDKLAAAMAAVTKGKDAKAAAALFATDADLTDHLGVTIKGRDKIEQHLTELFKQLGAVGKLTPAMTSVRPLGADVLVVDGTWEATGELKHFPAKGKWTILIHKRDGNWQLAGVRYMVPYEPPKR